MNFIICYLFLCKNVASSKYGIVAAWMRHIARVRLNKSLAVFPKRTIKSLDGDMRCLADPCGAWEEPSAILYTKYNVGWENLKSESFCWNSATLDGR